MLFPRAQAMFHHISRLKSHYRFSHLPSDGFATAGAKPAVTAVAVSIDPSIHQGFTRIFFCLEGNIT